MRLAILALACALMLAGCANDPKDDDATSTTTATTTDSDTTSSATGTQTSSSGTATGAPGNRAPQISLNASVGQGSVPFNVTFTLIGTDADGDDLTWTLQADNDTAFEAEGTSLPANHTEVYEEEGLYNVTFSVSDGTNTSVQSILVNATASGPAGAIEKHSCTVDAPTAPPLSPSIGGAVNVGSCAMVTLETDAILVTADLPDGCRVTYDANPNDNNLGDEAALGETYGEGGEFGMTCEVPEAGPDSTGTIGIQAV